MSTSAPVTFTDGESTTGNTTAPLAFVWPGKSPLQVSLETVNIVLSSFTIFCGFGNLIVLFFLIKLSKLKNSFNLYIILICISDLITSFLFLPLQMSHILSPATRTISSCRARILLRTMSYFLSLIVATEISILRLLSIITLDRFKKFLQTKYILAGVLLLQPVSVIVALPLLRQESATMATCRIGTPTGERPSNYWIFHVVLTLVVVIVIVTCYATLHHLIKKREGDSLVPANQSSVLLTLQVGILVTSTYFFFYFVPYIWVLVDLICAAFGKEIGASGLAGISQAELLSTIVCLQTCVDPLLYTLPSAHFRGKIRKFIIRTLARNHQVEPSTQGTLADSVDTNAPKPPASGNSNNGNINGQNT